MQITAPGDWSNGFYVITEFFNGLLTECPSRTGKISCRTKTKVGQFFLADDSAEHFLEVFTKTKAEAALAAGIFHRKEVPIGVVKEHLQDKVEIRPA